MAETVQAKSKAPILLVEGTAADQQIMANLAALALKKVGFKVMLMRPLHNPHSGKNLGIHH
jgi:hypothetical protein